MTTLFIITKAMKPGAVLFNSLQANSFYLILAEPDKKPYTTYDAAAAKIPSLGKGIFQIQKIFINQE